MKFEPPKVESPMPAPVPDPLAQLSAYEAGELDGTAADQVRAWLATSPEARGTLQRLQRLRQLTATLPAPQLAPGRRRVSR